jgi:hypothetical protein
MTRNFQAMRRYLDEIYAFVEQASNSPHHCASVLTVAHLCQSASDVGGDNYCREQLDLIELYAGDLFSEARHDVRQYGVQSGPQALKQKIRKCLRAIEARLTALERATA